MLRQGSVPAGAGLFGLVFAAGFVLGTIRELAVRPAIGPAIGPDAARLLELPVMIALSWLAARWILRRAGPGSAIWQFEVGLVDDEAEILEHGDDRTEGLGLIGSIERPALDLP